MTDAKNPTAWEYDHDRELHPTWRPGEWRYRVVEVVREHDHRSVFRDDPEHEKVSV